MKLWSRQMNDAISGFLFAPGLQGSKVNKAINPNELNQTCQKSASISASTACCVCHLALLHVSHNIGCCVGGEVTAHGEANPPCEKQPAKTTKPARIKRRERPNPPLQCDGYEVVGLITDYSV